MKKRIKSFAGFLCLALLAGTAGFFKPAIQVRADSLPELTDSGLNYTESLEAIHNPDRGFYRQISYPAIPVSGTSVPNGFSVSSLRGNLADGHPVVHLEFGLEHFSSNAYYNTSGGMGISRPLTDDVLSVLDKIMSNVREAGQTAFVRFDYNRRGYSSAQVGAPYTATYVRAEPDKATMLGHIAQLTPLFTGYSDVIVAVNTGFLGPWGEMHTTPMANDISVRNSIINALLDAVPANRTIMVRQPMHYREWYNAEYGTDYTAATMQNITAAPGTRAARISMYNDGYLGSADGADYGTFSRRADETAWLQKQTQFGFYGGECITDQPASMSAFNGYNDIEYIAYEGFLTHTSHLNISWNARVISGWKQTDYNVKPLPAAGGKSAVLDTLYKDAGATAFRYIENRMGYRFVVRDMKINAEAESGGKVYFRGEIENVGFGNTVNDKIVQLLFRNRQSGTVYRQATSLDTKAWLSSGGRVPLEFEADLKDGGTPYPFGEYDIYLKINDAAEKSAYLEGNMRSIRFANAGDNWDQNLGANRIGTVTSQATQSDECAVTLLDHDGSLIQMLTVNGGGSLDLSSVVVPDRDEGAVRHKFIGWGASYTKDMFVYKNLTFTALYTPVALYTVVFNANNGVLVEGKLTQAVEAGGAAEPPVLTREGYTLAGWNNQNYLNVNSNATVTAIWQKNPVLKPAVAQNTEAAIDLKSPAGAVYVFTMNDDAFEGLTGGVTADDYVFSDGTLTVKKGFIEGLPAGGKTFTATFTLAGNMALTLTVNDTREPEPEPEPEPKPDPVSPGGCGSTVYGAGGITALLAGAGVVLLSARRNKKQLGI